MMNAKTEYDFGRAYAEWLIEDGKAVEPVDIEQAATATTDIPEGDYRAMVDAGIANPDPRRYWDGYNSAF